MLKNSYSSHKYTAIFQVRDASILPVMLMYAKPLSLEAFLYLKGKNGVADGVRTHDNRNHNPGLYQLSYSHHYWPARQESNL